MKGRRLQIAVLLCLPAALVACTALLGIEDLHERPAAQPSEGGSTPEAGVLAFNTAPIDFGRVGCGKQASAQPITLTNTGMVALSWSGSLGGSTSAFSFAPKSGDLQPSESVRVTVTPAAIPSTASVTDNGFGDTLTIEAAGVRGYVDLRMTAEGAVIVVSPVSIDAGAVPYGGPGAVLPLLVTNQGNASASVSLGTQPPFAIAPAGPTTLAADASIHATATFQTAAMLDAATYPLSITVASTDTLCAPIPGLSATASSYLAPVEISAGTGNTCVRYSDGSVKCWGDNRKGQLGNGATGLDAGSSVPVDVVGLPTASTVSAGYLHTCAISAGTVYCWGLNLSSELGYEGANATAPTLVVRQDGGPILGVLTSVAALEGATCVLGSSGDVSCWGSYFGGAFGVDPAVLDDAGGVGITAYPYKVIPSNATYLGKSMTACTIVGGKARCWPTFDGDAGFAYPPWEVPGIADAVVVASASDHGCVVRQGGSVACWGQNTNGELGNGTTTDSIGAAVQVTGITDAVSVGAGQFYSCALRKYGEVLCWGNNNLGTLGVGGATPPLEVHVPTPVKALTDAVMLAVGPFHACALRRGGQVACWGRGDKGQLGNGQLSNSYEPVAVLGL